MNTRCRVPMVLMGVVCFGAPATVGAQRGLASRIDAVKTGRVRLTVAAREGVCGDGMSWFQTRSGNYTGTFNGNWNSSRDVEATCARGPVRLVIVREGHETTELRTYVGGQWKADTGTTDLGQVSAPEVGAWLLRLAEFGSAKPARAAITAATLTDSIDASATLLRIVKDERQPSDVRANALTWLGDAVGEKVSQTLDSIAYQPGDREVRRQAIFAVSRRPVAEAVPALLKLAESLPDRELRKTAVFWLVQSKDPRAVAWVEKRLRQ